MSATRLSALDASFLAAETPTAHMHVGWAAVFDPPESGRRPTFRELRSHIASRLGRAPRYRQRLAFVPLGVHDPVWVDDDRFDLERHVMRARSTDLDTIVADAMSSPLERSRPLWECWVAPRLDDGRIGVVGKVHHCMVDGLAAVELAALLLDPTAETPPAEAHEWTPEPAPGALSLGIRGVADRAREELSLLGVPFRVLSSRRRLADAANDARRAATSVVNSVSPAARPTRSLNADISPLRHLARIGRPIDDLVRIKSYFGATLNDVVLAVSSGGVRRFLEERGERPPALKAMVPVAVRSAGEASELGNRISFMFMKLPTDQADPVMRLDTINEETTERKRTGEAHGADALLKAMSYTPHVIQHALTALVASPRTFNLVVSNIPGPRAPMWMCGCRLRESYPVVPLADRHSLAIGVTSIGDGIYFGLYADRKTLPDADELAECVNEAIDELLVLCPAEGAVAHDGQPRHRRARERGDPVRSRQASAAARR
jgi:WS/DGAT/MGAT family acyltransferase